MPATPIAVDNDFFCKSEVLEIAELVLNLLGTERSESYILPTLIPQLTSGRGKLFRTHQEQASLLVKRAKEYKLLPEAPHEWLAKMLDVPDIDPGEAALFAHVASSNSMLLATGDKRALCAAPQVPGLCLALRGKVMTLEAALLELCAKHTVEAIYSRIAKSLFVDTVVRSCFGSCRLESVHEGLSSYIQQLRDKTDPQILWSPLPSPDRG